VIDTIFISDGSSVRVANSVTSVRKSGIRYIVIIIVGGNVIETGNINDGSSVRGAISVFSVRRSVIMFIVIIIVGVM
jgi:hypothetical protein